MRWPNSRRDRPASLGPSRVPTSPRTCHSTVAETPTMQVTLAAVRQKSVRLRTIIALWALQARPIWTIQYQGWAIQAVSVKTLFTRISRRRRMAARQPIISSQAPARTSVATKRSIRKRFYPLQRSSLSSNWWLTASSAIITTHCLATTKTSM